MEKRPKWLRILEEWRFSGGSGISAHALVNLSGVAWPTLRDELLKSREVDGFTCPDVHAPVFTFTDNNGCTCSGCTDKKRDAIALSDDLITRFPPSEYKGIEKMKGHKEWRLDRGWRTRNYGAEPNKTLEKAMLDFLNEA